MSVKEKFLHTVECALTIVNATAGAKGLREIDLTVLAEAAWETFLDDMRPEMAERQAALRQPFCR